MHTIPVLRLLGPLVTLNDHPLVGFPAKALVLVAYLLLDTKGFSSRENLAARLYEQADQQQANASLRQLLKRTRACQVKSNITLIEYDARLVRLSDSFPSCDVAELLAFQAVLEAADYEHILDLYSDELLAGYSSDGEDLNLWLAQRRHRISEHFAGLIANASANAGLDIPKRALSRVVSLCPYDDDVHAALIRQFAANGRLLEASQVYLSLKKRLAGDLKITEAPLSDAAYCAVVDRSRQQHAQIVSSSSGAPLDSQTRPSSVPRLALISPPMRLSDDIDAHTSIFVSGLIEEVSTALTRVKSFGVVAPFSARQFPADDPFEMLALYRVDYAVQTRLTKIASGKLRFATTLVRTQSRDVLWSESFLLSPQESHEQFIRFVYLLSSLVAEQVKHAEVQVLRTTQNPNAYQYCLLGQHYLHHSVDLPNVRRARRYFKSAIQSDVHYAAAHSAFAQTFILEWMMMTTSDTSLLDLAHMSASRAIELDSSDGNGHRQLGRVALFKGRFDESLELLNDAITIMPNHADLLADFADTLMHNSEVADAKRRIEHALLLNPLAPDVYHWIAGGIEFFSHNYQCALEHLRTMKNQHQVLRLMSACAAMAGDTAQASEYRRLSLEVDPYFELGTWLARLPQRDRVHLSFYADALRAAGFK